MICEINVNGQFKKIDISNDFTSLILYRLEKEITRNDNEIIISNRCLCDLLSEFFIANEDYCLVENDNVVVLGSDDGFKFLDFLKKDGKKHLA